MRRWFDFLFGLIDFFVLMVCIIFQADGFYRLDDAYSVISDLPNVLDQTDACLARHVRSTGRDKHASCL